MQRDNSVDHSQGGIKPLFKEDPLKQLNNFGAPSGDFTPKSNQFNIAAPLFRGEPETFA